LHPLAGNLGNVYRLNRYVLVMLAAADAEMVGAPADRAAARAVVI